MFLFSEDSSHQSIIWLDLARNCYWRPPSSSAVMSVMTRTTPRTPPRPCPGPTRRPSQTSPGDSPWPPSTLAKPPWTEAIRTVPWADGTWSLSWTISTISWVWRTRIWPPIVTVTARLGSVTDTHITRLCHHIVMFIVTGNTPLMTSACPKPEVTKKPTDRLHHEYHNRRHLLVICISWSFFSAISIKLSENEY